jgi:two-component system, chemotaxis family, protein-glutamate methylesterase/glutaminase
VAKRDIVVIGASAGGIEALKELISRFPGDLPASLFVVVHFPEQATSFLPKILAGSSHLLTAHALDGEPILPGRVYIAPPNHHLQLNNGKINLETGPREHGFRPAIDRLFNSAAHVFGNRVVGVILSGSLHDGVAGMHSIHRKDGVTIAQDPDEAAFPSMPRSAIERDHVDFILPISSIANKINELARNSFSAGGERVTKDLETSQERLPIQDSKIIREDVQAFEQAEDSPHRTIISCPDCGGVLWELRNGNLIKYECQIGHVYSEDSLLTEQGNVLENALWSAVRVLEQRAALIARLAMYAEQNGHQHSAERFRKNSDEAEHNADVIRQLIQRESFISLPISVADGELEGDNGDG